MAKKSVNAGFKSKEEMLRALMDNPSNVYTFNGERIVFNPSFVIPFIGHGDKPDFPWVAWARVEVEEEIEWWDDIPSEGVLCWVGDARNPSTVAVRIRAYDGGSSYPFMAANGRWSYATPIEPSECLQQGE